jgi:hypothetical protein
MPSYKAILIDSVNFTITEVQVREENLVEDICAHLNCTSFEVPLIREDGTGLYIDEEGRLYENFHQRGFFALADWPHEPYLCGKGLLLGTDEHGDSVDVQCTIQEVINTTGFGVVDEERGTLTILASAEFIK